MPNNCEKCGRTKFENPSELPHTSGGFPCSCSSPEMTTTPGEVQFVQVCTCGVGCPVHPASSPENDRRLRFLPVVERIRQWFKDEEIECPDFALGRFACRWMDAEDRVRSSLIDEAIEKVEGMTTTHMTSSVNATPFLSKDEILYALRGMK